VRRKFFVRHARVVGVMALVVALLGLSTGPSSAASAAAKKPKKGGTLTYLSVTEPTTLWGEAAGPRVSAKSGPERLAILDALLVLTKKGVPQYRLAESLTSTDGITWTMKMRSGAKFTDGTPVDAEAVKYNWDLMKDPANATLVPSGAAAFVNIASYTVTDPSTLTITLKAKNGMFAEFLTTSVADFIGSPTALKSMGIPAFQAKPVGAGAFTFGEWTRGSQLTLNANPDYYGNGPFLDKLVFKYILDDTQRYNTLVTGGGDVAYTAVHQTAARGKDAGYTTPVFAPPGGVALVFNSGIPPFNELRARQALSLAIDSDGLNQAVFGGLGRVMTHIFPSDSEYYTKSAKQATPNAKKAQALFDELAKEGKPVEFAFMVTDSAPYPAVVQYISARLASFQNVKMTINQVSSQAFLGPYLAKSYQVFTGAFITDPIVFYNQFTATGPSNRFNYSNPATDQALAEMANATTPADRKKALAKAQELVVKDVGMYFMIQSPVYAIFKKSVVGAWPTLDTGMPDWPKVWRTRSS
jgi:peptide/nickel transport system substrate-binding protein